MKLFNVLLTIHIVCGSISLILGFYIMLAKKGNSTHKLLGKIFFYSMLLNSTVAIPMTYFHPNPFLFLISIFTLYMLITGVRYLNKKSVADVKTIDWFITFIMFVFAIVFIGLGVYFISKGNSFGIVLITFGCVGFLFSKIDRKNFKGNSKTKNFFLTTHIQRMVGSYIATLTAFLVVNNTFLPNVLAWLLPTIILVPLILIWTKKYSIKCE